jgi:hypothetical protein
LPLQWPLELILSRETAATEIISNLPVPVLLDPAIGLSMPGNVAEARPWHMKAEHPQAIGGRPVEERQPRFIALFPVPVDTHPPIRAAPGSPAL